MFSSRWCWSSSARRRVASESTERFCESHLGSRVRGSGATTSRAPSSKGSSSTSWKGAQSSSSLRFWTVAFRRARRAQEQHDRHKARVEEAKTFPRPTDVSVFVPATRPGRGSHPNLTPIDTLTVSQFDTSPDSIRFQLKRTPIESRGRDSALSDVDPATREFVGATHSKPMPI